MTRVKRGTLARHNRKNIRSLAAGAIGSTSRLYTICRQSVIKSLRYQYQSRKRQYKSMYVVRLNARVRIYGLSYSSFLHYLRKKKCWVNRQILMHIALFESTIFPTLLK
jgi:large subunit ribosomal protein L20